MNKFKNLNVGHLILSPSIYDVDKFKGLVPFIINWIFEKKSISFYSISEEYGDNNHYHLDIILFSKSQINKNILNNKGDQIGLRGHLQEKCGKGKLLPNTIMKEKSGLPFYDYESEQTKNDHEYNVKFLIGYNFKEGPETNWNNLEITEEEKKEFIKFYSENETKSKKIISQDIIQIHPKNAMYEMKKYLKDVQNPNYHKLISETVKKGYCWIGMSKNQTRKLILQLKIIKEDIDTDEEDEINEDTYKKFEEQELEILKAVRNQPRQIRLKTLYEMSFISKQEYETMLI